MGEEAGWLRLASHLCMSLDRVKMETSVSQFVLWMAYLEQEINAFHREDYYLAQIAAEVRRGIVKEPKKISIKDFLLKFIVPKKQIQEISPEVRLAKSKQYWLSIVGLNRKKK